MSIAVRVILRMSFHPSSQCSAEEEEVEMTDVEKKHLEKLSCSSLLPSCIESMGVNVEKDELYDPNVDDKNEEWTKSSHCNGALPS